MFLIQARPETVHGARERKSLIEYRLEGKGKILTKGISIGEKIGQGRANIIKDVKEIGKFKKGEILVTKITDPDWEPIMKIASGIVTDSGGVQKEAYFNKVPCITLRENTEWVETIEQGVNQLVGVDPEKIEERIINFHPQKENYSKELFGDGKTSAKIIEILLSN